MFYLVLINGLVDSFNPCAIGVLIFYLTLVFSLKVERKSFVTFGLFYILATFATYFLIGLGILRVMHLFGIHNFFGWLAAVLVLILGFFNLKEFFFPFWTIPFLSSIFNKCRVPNWKPEFTIFSAIILGFLIGICEFPCSGGIYLATVSLLTVKATFWQGVSYLLVYNVMFILPLVVLFLSVSNKQVFRFFQSTHEKTSRYARLAMGISMVISGILLLIWLIK